MAYIAEAMQEYMQHMKYTQCSILEHTHVPGPEKLTCVGSWETGCVDRNWAGGNLGTLVPSRFGQLVSQLLLASSEYLEYLRH